MDAELQSAIAQFAEIVLRNSATSISERIRSVKARKADSETIAVLDEIVSELQSDRSQLIGIVQAFEQELVA